MKRNITKEAGEVCLYKIGEFLTYLKDELNHLKELQTKDSSDSRIRERIAGTELAIDKINNILKEVIL